jgi:hypothetical protein
MASDHLAVCVHSERPVVERQRYELSVYAVAGGFYASWFCTLCGEVHETARATSKILAQDEGAAAIDRHHAARHHDRQE